MDWSLVDPFCDYCNAFIIFIYFDVHSDSTQSLQRIHCSASDVMRNFSKSVLTEKKYNNSATFWVTWGWVLFQQISICTISLTTAQLVCYSSFWRNCLVFCTCPVQTMTNPAWRGRCQGVPAHWGTSPRPRSTIVLNHAANWCLRSSLRDMGMAARPTAKASQSHVISMTL